MIIKMILNNPMIDDPRVYKEAKYYVSQGNDVEILCWDRENRACEDEVLEGIKLHRIHVLSKPGSGLLKQMVPYLKFRKACIDYLKDKDFDILHCHDLDGAIVGLSVKTKAKKVFDMHEYYLTRGPILNIPMAYFVKKAQNKFDYIIYLNDTQKADIENKNLNKLLFLPNYPEKSLFYDIEKTKSNFIRVGYAGNVRAVKTFKNLFLMANKYDNIKVDIYGSGVTIDELKDDQNDKITLHGHYNYKDSNEIYKNIDLVNCVYDNTLNDSFPIKLFESMVTKTPVIVDRKSIKAKLVEKYDIGFLVDVDDIETYDQLFSVLSENPSLLDEKRKNYDNIKEKFVWDDAVKVLNEVK